MALAIYSELSKSRLVPEEAMQFDPPSIVVEAENPPHLSLKLTDIVSIYLLTELDLKCTTLRPPLLSLTYEIAFDGLFYWACSSTQMQESIKHIIEINPLE